MAYTLKPRLLTAKGYEQRKAQQGFKLIWWAWYGVPDGKTLADMSLEEGDNFPEDSDYEIMSAVLGPEAGGYSKVVEVRAEMNLPWS